MNIRELTPEEKLFIDNNYTTLSVNQMRRRLKCGYKKLTRYMAENKYEPKENIFGRKIKPPSSTEFFINDRNWLCCEIP